MSQAQPVTDRLHRVVVIGSGFGGLFAAKALRKAPVQVTLIAKTNHHLFQPLLYQVATGILSQGEIAPPTREILKRHESTEVLLGEVTSIDVDANRVHSRVGQLETITEYDSIIVAAGAGGSYFGHDEFEVFAPGLKSVDDALELRGRILGAFEIAELSEDPAEVESWMTFVVVGAGATGVEMAGQIRELSGRALRGDFRRINPTKTRVILVDGGDNVLAAFGDKQSERAKTQLEKMNIEVKLQAMVTDVDADSVTIKHQDGTVERIESKVKVWAAGVAASPLAKQLGDQTAAEVDKTGRVCTLPDLTLPGHPEVFVIGDMASLNNYPGVAQVAMQGGKYAAEQIRRRVEGDKDADAFNYFDKGSMATISRFKAVANVGKLRLSGFIAWLMWLFIHILYLVGFQQRVSTLGHWTVAFLGRGRAERTITTFQTMATIDLVNAARAAQANEDFSAANDNSAADDYSAGLGIAPERVDDPVAEPAHDVSPGSSP
ncbi:MAG: NAD(P)/FAD-dependent oxidoreductase [Candidatus Nanopelagicales bacterium]